MPSDSFPAVCVYALDNGGSALTEIDLPICHKEIAADGSARWEGVGSANGWGIAAGDPEQCTQWHVSGMAGLSITLCGEWEIEASNGDRRTLRAGDVLVMLDTTGDGHRSWPSGAGRCLTMGVAFGEGDEQRMRARLAEAL